MATWRLRNADGEREGLTVYQLEQLVRVGKVGADDEVASEGPFQKVRDVPQLARHLPETGPAPAPAGFLEINGVKLEIGEDGRPKPPSPEVIAQMLAADSDRPAAEARTKRTRTVIAVLLFLALAALVWLFAKTLLTAPPAE